MRARSMRPHSLVAVGCLIPAEEHAGHVVAGGDLRRTRTKMKQLETNRFLPPDVGVKSEKEEHWPTGGGRK